MGFFETFLIALSMSMDAFAVCLGAGTMQHTRGRRPAFRLSFHFGLFQAIMPIVGWFLGSTIEKWIEPFDHWVAFGLLAFIGARMLRSAIKGEEDELKQDPSRGWNLVLLSVATSIDALAIGLTLAFLGVVIWTPALVIGVVTGLISLLGVYIGNCVGEKFGRIASAAGGILLICIGLRIVMSHLFV
jgi:putative Mn2+ efflux pump MntP